VFQEARNDHLHLVAVIGNQLAEERDRQERVARLGFLFENDLCQYRVGNVVPAFCILDRKILPLLYHLRQVFQRYVSAGACVVEAAIGVFLDYDLPVILRHISLPKPV